MRFSTIATAVLAPLCAQAVVMFTNNAYNGIATGAPFTLTWSGDGTPVTIDLLNGPTRMLVKVDAVANGVSGSSYSWTPPKTLQAGTYALSITQSGSTNYSPQFAITSNSVSTFANTPTTTPAQSLPPPLNTVGRAILISPLSLPPMSNASPQQYPPPSPTLTVVSDFNTSSTTIYVHTRYTNTIRPTTPVTNGSSLRLYTTGLMNSSVPSHSNGNLVFPTGVHFEDGATRPGGFGLGCLVAAMFGGTVLARYAF